MYNDCTLDGADDGKPWCSTKTDSYGNHIPGGGHYVHCPMSTTSIPQGEVSSGLHVFGLLMGDYPFPLFGLVKPSYR